MKGTRVHLFVLLVVLMVCGGRTKAMSPVATLPEAPVIRPAAFSKASAWQVIVPGGVTLERDASKEDSSVWNFDLSAPASYWVLRLNFETNLPDNFEMSFVLSGHSEANNLELKVTDVHGNTFRKTWRNVTLSGEPKTYRAPFKELRYAWGKHPEILLKDITGVEWALVAGSGGTGVVEVADLLIKPLEPLPELPAMTARASSERSKGEKAICAMDRNPASQWRSESHDREWVEFLFEEPLALAGLNIYWEFPGDYDVLATEDGDTWRLVYHQENSLGGLDEIYFTPITVKGLRIQGLKQATREGYAIREIEFKYPDERVKVSSSEASNNTAEQAMDGNQKTAWRHSDNKPAWLQVDLNGEKAWGGLVIHWGDDYAADYEVEISSNGINWSPVHTARDEEGGTHEIYLAETEARFLRVMCQRSGTGMGYAINDIELRAPDETMTPTRYFQIAAKRLPGCYPRWLLNEQAYWTLAGSPTDTREASLCEDGTLEPHKRGFTIMPLLKTDRILTRDDAVVACSLLENSLPIPSVHWVVGDITMDVQLTTTLDEQSIALARYTLANTGKESVTGALELVVHPIQVYPPWQYGTDGFAPINSLVYRDGTATINETQDVHFLTMPASFSARPGTYGIGHSVKGDIVDDLVEGDLPKTEQAHDPDGFASGCAEFPFSLAPGETKEVFLAVPLHEGEAADLPVAERTDPKALYERTLAASQTYWNERVNRMDIRIPDADLLDALKANIAYNLVTKDGVGFQPGSRSYDKAWMRDGGVAAIALLKVGLREEIRDFLAWMASYQFENGEIAPIIDNKAEDPLWEEKEQNLHEFDSQGEFIHTLLSYYYFTGDRAFLEEMYPRVVKALEFLQELREQRATPEYRDDPEKRVFYNILPPSRSHEGYFLAHSYWDDFWALVGWKDGVKMAEILGDDERVPWMQEQYEELRDGVYNSIRAVMKRDDINYIPGCAEKGDYDATSTAAALVFCDELRNMPQPQTTNTFRRYCEEIQERMEPGAEYVYTPYEIRSVLALLKLGWKQEALDLLDFLLAARRPMAWQHLAEVVHSDLRFPCYIGDMPHTWVGAGVINSIRGLFVYETGEQLILGAGVKPEWLDEGVEIRDLPTWFGKVSYRMREKGNQVAVEIAGDVPDDGVLLKNPLMESPTACSVNGKPYETDTGDVLLRELPAKVVLTYGGVGP